jgi:sodium-dependent dicarboxylate transporter 2/3/5
MPWEVLLLLGGGMAIARAFEQTGLSMALANLLQPMIGHTSPFVLVLAVCALMVMLTEFASNTAITALMLPILKSAAVTAQVDPRLLMLPATVAASLGFMMPAGTPPNAIVYSSGYVPLKRMVWLGLWLDLLAILLVALTTWFLVIPVMGIDPGRFPTWAQAR